MIVIRAYAHGAGVKVRLEQHVHCCKDGNCGGADQDATERAYPARGSSPRETTAEVARAIGRLWRGHSNITLTNALHERDTLPGL